MSFRIRVFDSRIHAMSMPGGMIYRYGNGITREVLLRAVETAPMAKKDWGPGHFRGRLKASHHITFRGNQYGCFGSVINDAPYALFVHQGTRMVEPIRPQVQPYMVFYVNHKRYRREEVQGQDPQPWLQDAAERVWAHHGIV